MTRFGPLVRVYSNGRAGVGTTRRDAASVFCAAYYDRLAGGLALYLGDRAVAEELAQEALLRAFARWEHVETLASPEAWTWRVAMNLANSVFRRRDAERRARQRLGPAPEVGDEDHAAPLAVREAVAGLPKPQRMVLVLRFYLDLSVAETAARMASTDDAVRSLTKRAVAALGDVLDLDQTREGHP